MQKKNLFNLHLDIIAVKEAEKVMLAYPVYFEETVDLLTAWIRNALLRTNHYQSADTLHRFTNRLFPERLIFPAHLMVALARCGYDVRPGKKDPQHFRSNFKGLDFNQPRAVCLQRPDTMTMEGLVVKHLLGIYWKPRRGSKHRWNGPMIYSALSAMQLMRREPRRKSHVKED